MPVDTWMSGMTLDAMPVDTWMQKKTLDAMPVETWMPRRTLDAMPVETRMPAMTLDAMPVETRNRRGTISGAVYSRVLGRLGLPLTAISISHVELRRQPTHTSNDVERQRVGCPAPTDVQKLVADASTLADRQGHPQVVHQKQMFPSLDVEVFRLASQSDQQGASFAINGRLGVMPRS